MSEVYQSVSHRLTMWSKACNKPCPPGVHLNSIWHDSCQLPFSIATMAVYMTREKNAKLNEGSISDWLIRKKLQHFIHKNPAHPVTRRIVTFYLSVTGVRPLHYNPFAKTIGLMIMSHESESWVWCILWNISSSMLEWTDPLAQCRNEGDVISATQWHTG